MQEYGICVTLTKIQTGWLLRLLLPWQWPCKMIISSYTTSPGLHWSCQNVLESSYFCFHVWNHFIHSPLPPGIINILGLPITQCPLGLGEEGLPLGVQVIAGKLHDHLTLEVALYLEKTFGGWRDPGANWTQHQYWISRLELVGFGVAVLFICLAACKSVRWLNVEKFDFCTND